MELRQLRYFVTLAEELHFSRAAKKLHIAQPALSQQFKKLEKELGFSLLYRTSQKVELLPSGKIFLERCQKILNQIDRAVEDARRAHKGETGSLAVGFVGSASYSVLPRILKIFRNKYPHVELLLHEKTTAQQLKAFESNSIQVGFVRPPIPESGLGMQTVLEEPFVAALPEDHILLKKKRVELKDLADERFILFPRNLGSGLYDLIINQCQKAGFSPNIVQEAILMQTIASLVAGGIGISIVPQSVSNLNLNGVEYRQLKNLDIRTTIALIWEPDTQNPIVENFRSCI